MNKELTLMEKLILSEMAGAKYGRGRRLIREAGNDPMGGGDDPMGGAGDDPMGGSDPMGGAGDLGGGAGPMGGGDDAMGGGADAMGGGAGPMGGGDDPMGGAGPMGGDDPMGGGPMGGPMGGDDPMGGPLGGGPMGGPDDEDEEEDDTETLNIDDLTNAQEKMNNKINTIGRNQITTDKSIEQLLGSFQSLISKIDSQNAEIQRLQQDIIKRNPTPTEDLYLQSLASYPYNTNIADYWKNYIANGKENYNVVAGGMAARADGGQSIDGSNVEPEETVYEITTDDLDNMQPDSVYKSMSMNNTQEDNHNWFNPRF